VILGGGSRAFDLREEKMGRPVQLDLASVYIYCKNIKGADCFELNSSFYCT
jgi:hypothetical protein